MKVNMTQAIPKPVFPFLNKLISARIKHTKLKMLQMDTSNINVYKKVGFNVS